MKKKNSYLVLLMVMVLLMLLVSPHVYAEENEFTAIQERINAILDNGTNYIVKDSLTLKSSDGTAKYVCFDLEPYGYAVYNNMTGMFEEISHYATDLPYQFDTEYDCYYLGPNNYFYLIEGELVHTSNNTVLDDAVYSELLEIEAQKDGVEVEQNARLSARSGATVYGTSTAWVTTQMANYGYFTSLLGDSFGYNVNGTCTMVASAILLGYYDHYVSDAYVPVQYENGYGTTEEFHQVLCNMMNPSGGSAGLNTAKTSLNEGFAYLNLNAAAYTVIGNHEGVFSIVKSKIASNRPVVAAMFTSYNEDCPMNHSVVVYGYKELQVIATGEVIERYYYVHTGWHSTKLATYNYAWFADVLYINR